MLILLLWIPFVSGSDIDNSTDINTDLTEYDMSDTSVDEISISNDSVDLDVNDYSIVLKSGNDLVRGSAVNVSGHVFDSDERPVKYYLLVVESDDWMNEVYTDGDGFFTTECFIDQDLTYINIAQYNGDILFELNLTDESEIEPVVDDVTIIEPSPDYVNVNSSNEYNETINEIITTEPTVKYDSDKMFSGESSEISKEVTNNAPYVIVKDVDDSNTKTKTTSSSNIKNTVSGFLTKNIKESGNFIHVTKNIYPNISMETVGSDIGSDYNESLDESILVSEQSTDNQSESIIEYILSLLSEIYRWFSSLF